MDTRQLVESPLAGAAAAAGTLDTPIPATLGTRRDFCVAACQALSLGAIAATLQACGGGSNPNEPSGGVGNVPTLPSLNATVANGAATLTVDGTALSSAGGAAMVTSATRHDAGGPQRRDQRVGLHRDLHAPAVHDQRLHRERVPVPVPRLALQPGERRVLNAARPRSRCAASPRRSPTAWCRSPRSPVRAEVGHPRGARLRSNPSNSRRSASRASRRCRRRG